jgi:hypothetical protein
MSRQLAQALSIQSKLPETLSNTIGRAYFYYNTKVTTKEGRH